MSKQSSITFTCIFITALAVQFAPAGSWSVLASVAGAGIYAAIMNAHKKFKD